MKRIIIQEEIKVTQEFIDEIIKHYESMPDSFGMGILSVVLNKKGAIREIKMLSEVGKALLLMRYKFKEWEKNLKE